jgi:plastocyanin
MVGTIESPPQKAQEVTATTMWMRVARGTAIGVLVWAVVLHLVARVPVPPVIVIALIFAGFAPFLRGERRKLGLAYGIVSVLLLLANMPGLLDELAHYDSAPSFVLTLASTLIVLIAAAAGFGAFFQWSPAAIQPVLITAAVVFVLGTAVSVAAFASAESDVALATDAQVTAEKVSFGPDTLTVAAGEAGVWVDNKDGIHHTFTVEALGFELEIPALKSRRVDFDAAPGTYAFICTVPGHESMTGTLVVEG